MPPLTTLESEWKRRAKERTKIAKELLIERDRCRKALECIAEFAETEGSPFALSVAKTARNALSPENV